MKKYTYILGVSMLSLVSQVSAAATVLNTPADQEPYSPAGQELYSPAGHHGSRNGGMTKGLPSSASTASFSVAIVQPAALEFLIPGDHGTATPTAMLAFSSTESVADLKARIIEGYRLPAGIRFMVGEQEVMRDVVRCGTLVTLAEAFAGKSGIVQITVVLDSSRSPMHSAMPTPQPGSPSAATPLELPSVSE